MTRATQGEADERRIDFTATAGRLVRAAAAEFRRHGFAGTDTNKIARRAGFAPQTFYRWFPDKRAIFLAVYRRFEEDELQMLREMVSERAAAAQIAAAVVAHHRKYQRFRRSLRQLSLEAGAVRKARAQSRRRQIERIGQLAQLAPGQRGAVAAALLQIERLADALAERELKDLGFGEAETRLALEELIRALQPATQRSR